jgi:hypothetical protein
VKRLVEIGVPATVEHSVQDTNVASSSKNIAETVQVCLKLCFSARLSGSRRYNIVLMLVFYHPNGFHQVERNCSRRDPSPGKYFLMTAIGSYSNPKQIHEPNVDWKSQD